jgi:hypothetical protein
MANNDVYTLRNEIVVSTAITVLQIKCGASNPCEIIRASVSQRGSTTSAEEIIELVRKSAAATVTAAVAGTTLLSRDPGQPTAGLSLGTSATGHTATAEGTDTDVILKEGFNVLNGWLYLPVPEERIYVPAGGIIGLKFPVAPASQTWEFTITVREF